MRVGVQECEVLRAHVEGVQYMRMGLLKSRGREMVLKPRGRKMVKESSGRGMAGTPGCWCSLELKKEPREGPSEAEFGVHLS